MDNKTKKILQGVLDTFLLVQVHKDHCDACQHNGELVSTTLIAVMGAFAGEFGGVRENASRTVLVAWAYKEVMGQDIPELNAEMLLKHMPASAYKQ